MSEVSTDYEETADALSARQLLGKIFYRPSEVFAVQRQKRVSGRILILLVAISLTYGWLSEISSTSELAVEAQASSSDVASLTEHVSNRSDYISGNARSNNADSDLPTTSADLPYRIEDDQPRFGFLEVSDIVWTFLGLIVLLWIEALYLRAVSAIMGIGLTLDYWFALVIWSRVPGEALLLLITVAFVVPLFVSNEWFGFDLPVLRGLFESSSSDDASSLGYVFDIWWLPEIWVLALMTIGFRDWSGQGKLVSFAIVCVPTVVLIGVLWWFSG